ncbi:MAG: phenylalanine--tRNA ligase subunit beta [Acidimicrobiaceae bacterium]|nr:phenylalanine--tRNA ligase subunit beta [Acidimicrobiaceae bacterium]MXZ98200.1 phenylalanine--tRNA ligase subunit beta [Acidimicrobiaceae bacterium]MYE77239.1 phenylalanine--tRNA ligase subunit beta [Acidimicrobiaceae bacterium]MYE98018.1 phenylalanine--tRNA ligase subunit beta [Acidimicrobiaceae bacterium]MYH44190.1 phenylalanine--tRNA ligase subunit beta [Acidimicrobiaceae bacterium]
MKVLLSWLREFAPGIDGDPGALSDVLSALGLTVEEMTVTGAMPGGVVLGRVLDLRPHPDADRIQLVDVDDGSGSTLQVCCGAFNMAVGDLVPLARVGTVMPSGLEIARRKLRGQTSDGMCCSEIELDLGADAEGIMILNDRVAPGAEPGAPLAEAVGLEPDVLWDLDVGANRPDALSVMGVARDLAAGLGVAFDPPDWSTPASGPGISEAVDVEIVDPTLCGRFVGRVLRHAPAGSSPPWMANRLTALGQRPINSIVDISNYVMLELGQPSHTFDLGRVSGARIRARRAHDGETIVTLDGQHRILATGDGVIADGDDGVIGIAGVMGGASTEIDADTTDVLVEMAWWDPPSISRTAKRLNLSSEAATRFRRGADWGYNVERCMNRFVQLAAEQGAEVAPGTIDERGNLPDRRPLRVRTSRVNSLLGTSLSAEVMAGHLGSIGFGADLSHDGAGIDVTIPTWRWDTETETDIAEEVARLHGYENIERTVPTANEAGGLSAYQRDRRLVREVLVGAGCCETQPMPFVAPGALAAVGLAEDGVTLSNPVDDSESVLRTSLLPGQLGAVAYNQRHFNADVRLFEIGRVYLPASEGQLLPDEREFLAVALSGEEAPAAVAVLDLLAEALALPAVELRQPVSFVETFCEKVRGASGEPVPREVHPTRSAEVVVAGRTRGVVGEVDSAVLESCGVSGRVAWLQLDLQEVLEGPRTRRRYRPVSKYPPSDVDLAFVVPDEVAAVDVERALRTAAGPLLARLELRDVHRDSHTPDGTRSLAYRLTLQALDRTLDEAGVTEARRRCIEETVRLPGVSLSRGLAPSAIDETARGGSLSGPQALTVDIDETRLSFKTDWGTFSADRLSPGTRLLLDRAPPLTGDESRVLDLGCGWGAIACVFALRHPEAEVLAVDVNPRALKLTRENAATNRALNVTVTHPDDVDPDGRFERVLCFPPIPTRGKGEQVRREVLSTWLPRLTPAGRAHLVVPDDPASDSLVAWLTLDNRVTTLTSEAGFRLLEVQPRDASAYS